MPISIRASSDTLSAQFYRYSASVLSFGANTNGQLSGFRNKIINGDCRIHQRGAVSVNTPNTWTYGGADRMVSAITTGGTVSTTISRDTVPNTICSSGYCQVLTSTTTSASSVISMGQRIEANNCLDLNSSQVTFSVTVWHDLGSAQACTLKLFKPQTTADTWSGTPIQIGVSGTFNVSPAAYTRLSYTFTLNSTDASGGLFAVVVYDPVSALSSKNFQFADFMLEKVDIETKFETRQYNLELELCQRYYEASPLTVSTYFNGNVTNAVAYYSAPSKFMAAKRITPTMTFYNISNTNFPATPGTAYNVTPRSCQETRTANATGMAAFASRYEANAEL